MTDIKKAALDYARAGCVIALTTERKKHVLAWKYGGPKEKATRDPDILTHQIDTASGWEPGGVGIVTGQSGLVVVDVDIKNGTTIDDLYEKWPSLRCSDVISRTPSGGWHIYFAYTGGDIGDHIGQVMKGVDIKGELLAYEWPCAGYKWESGFEPGYDEIIDPPHLPDDFASYLRDLKRTPTAQDGKRFDQMGKIEEGYRDDFLHSKAGEYRLLTNDPALIMRAVWADNLDRCDPPLDRQQAMKCANSAMKYDNGPDEPIVAGLSFETSCFTSREIDQREEDEPESWLSTFLRPASTTLIHAAPGVGKTPLAMQIADAGQGFRNLFNWRGDDNTMAKRTLYLDGELPMWMTKRNKLANVTMGNDDFYCFNATHWMLENNAHISFTNPAYQEMLIRLINKIEPDILVMDNRSNFYIGDENDNNEAQEFNRFQNKLRGMNMATVINHHQGKSHGGRATARGASSIIDNVNTVIRLDEKGFYREPDGSKYKPDSRCFKLTCNEKANLGLPKMEFNRVRVQVDQLTGAVRLKYFTVDEGG